MDQDLQRLIRDLRAEKCPQRVLDEVAKRIREQQRPTRRIGYRIAAITAALALLCGLALWPRPTVREARRHPEQVGTSLERAQVAAETRGALGYIGGVLIAASAHTEQIVLNQALPPLRNSFSNARIKLLNHIEP